VKPQPQQRRAVTHDQRVTWARNVGVRAGGAPKPLNKYSAGRGRATSVAGVGDPERYSD